MSTSVIIITSATQPSIPPLSWVTAARAGLFEGEQNLLASMCWGAVVRILHVVRSSPVLPARGRRVHRMLAMATSRILGQYPLTQSPLPGLQHVQSHRAQSSEGHCT